MASRPRQPRGSRKLAVAAILAVATVVLDASARRAPPAGALQAPPFTGHAGRAVNGWVGMPRLPEEPVGAGRLFAVGPVPRHARTAPAAAGLSGEERLAPYAQGPYALDRGGVTAQRIAQRSALGRSRPPLMDESGFSSLSYYTTLALFVLSFPGLYSLVKRSVKSKVVRKTYEVAGPAASGGRPTREVAGDIVAYFQANNYKITDAADTIIFEGLQQSLNGRAAFLTFCTFVGFAAFALVLTIFEQGVFREGIETPLGVFKGLGNVWYLSTLVSPLAGKYYLDNAERTEQVSVKIVTEDDEMSSEIIVQGDDEEIDRFQKTLDLREKGMVYVKGIFQDA